MNCFMKLHSHNLYLYITALCMQAPLPLTISFSSSHILALQCL